jgi:Flp pilus assembly protein TadD
MESRRPRTIIVVIAAALIAAESGAAQVARKGSSPTAGSQREVTSLAREVEQAASRGDWEGAVRGYEQLVKTSPGVAEFHLGLGVACYSSGRPHEAVAALRQALKLKPALLTASQFLGAALADSGQCQEALAYLKQDASRLADQELKRTIGLAGVRCGMKLNRLDEGTRPWTSSGGSIAISPPTRRSST